ncbi:MAG: hypothetical protein COA32_12055 [Fluviicola sp.]|nr:MAG: hypothetical protein COA32_12055 [Fluviicola sp.]
MNNNFENQNNANSLSQNRAEEFGFDLFKDFVIPPIYEKIDFEKTSKSKIFIGGRGCGKTMLLRYLSHQTSFSEKKEKITNDTIENIGLYWKVDTLTVHQLQKRGMPDDIWQSAFEHLFTLILLKEFIESLESIAKSKFDEFSTENFRKIKLDSFNSFGIQFNGGLNEFKKFINFKRDEFQSWLRNVRKGTVPLFFPKTLIESLINDLKGKIPFINKSRFNIYIDEYENLIEYQQKIVNTWVKHSENPIIFHLAMKRNAFKTKETVSTESLSNIHDYRIHDLEEGFHNKKEFRVFAAEIILYRLYSQGSLKGVEFNSNLLIEPKNYYLRKDEAYQARILSIINDIFPSSSNKELANQILDDSLLYKRLIDRLNDALGKRKSALPATDFIYYDDNRVSIVCTSLLRREKIDPVSLKKEIVKLKKGEDNKFFNKTEWVKNNFVGSYLLFYSSLSRACPLYTGFSIFCEMSNGNIRHLTELCYKTFLRASDNTSNDISFNIWRINLNHQSLAAKQASSTFLNEIKTFGGNGNQLHTFVMRLGNLFRLAHSNPKQSEPEQNHFSIAKGNELSSVELYPLLNEAIKWSVLFEHESTKKKSNIGPDLNEYVLNPIYAPYFHISYRKKRKLEFTTETLNVLLNGGLDEYEKLLKSYKEKWNLIEKNEVSNLFSDLDI